MSDSIRECGSCSACCTVIGVHEIGKGTYETCEHLCEGGCGIYAERPGSSQTFECQWLRGALEVDGAIDTEMRPDASGVIFDYHPDTAFGELLMHLLHTTSYAQAPASGRHRNAELGCA